MLHTVKMSFAHTQPATVMELLQLLHFNCSEYLSTVFQPEPGWKTDTERRRCDGGQPQVSTGLHELKWQRHI